MATNDMSYTAILGRDGLLCQLQSEFKSRLFSQRASHRSDESSPVVEYGQAKFLALGGHFDIVKSSDFSPVTGCPFLSVTTTSTITRRVLVLKVIVGTSPDPCCPLDWAF